MTLNDYRQQIDSIDHQLVALFTERLHIVEQIADIKIAAKLPLTDEKREMEILQSLGDLCSPKDYPYVATLFHEIFNLSKARQKATAPDFTLPS